MTAPRRSTAKTSAGQSVHRKLIALPAILVDYRDIRADSNKVEPPNSRHARTRFFAPVGGLEGRQRSAGGHPKNSTTETRRARRENSLPILRDLLPSSAKSTPHS